MRLFYFLVIVCSLLVFDQHVSSAQVVLYPNGKRVKILSSRAGAHQLSGNQQRYIITGDKEVYVDPKKIELDTAEARARLAYPNQEEHKEKGDSNN